MSSSLTGILREGNRIDAQRPWQRVIVKPKTWNQAAAQLVEGTTILLGLWADTDAVHMALLNEEPVDIAVITIECVDGRFPSVGRHHPAAIRFERAIRDIYGLEAEGSLDQRPWLDHGHWRVKQPLGKRVEVLSPAPPYHFLQAEGESLHQIPVGPVHAGIIEPGHFRFTANGETVVRLEQRLGFVHKGIESLMVGADLARAAQLASRTSGDSTVAYAIAFAHAVEAAFDLKVPARATWLRALMAELERLANHFGDFGAVCNDASFSLLHVQCGMLRERILRVASSNFGHRLMMDRIIPGGVSTDLSRDGLMQVKSLLAELTSRLPRLVELYDNTASLQDRMVTTGILQPELARKFGAGGYIGRASGRSFDARRAIRYAPYDELRFDIPVLNEGDVNARVWIRIREIEQSLAIIDQIITMLPHGPIAVSVGAPKGASEGIAMVEGFRGDILVWVRFDNSGRLTRCHLRDPSWFQWPLLEAVVEGNIVADFPLCNKSFNCSYSGHDL
jgi:Ni,Fe-hydrogenase III large subunit/Ni,Fe-hydrogenase III component G